MVNLNWPLSKYILVYVDVLHILVRLGKGFMASGSPSHQVIPPSLSFLEVLLMDPVLWVRLGKGVWFWESPRPTGNFPVSVILLLPHSCTATPTHTPAAYKYADGRKIDGMRVVVDVERGRTVKGWKPRSLGEYLTELQREILNVQLASIVFPGCLRWCVELSVKHRRLNRPLVGISLACDL